MMYRFNVNATLDKYSKSTKLNLKTKFKWK